MNITIQKAEEKGNSVIIANTLPVDKEETKEKIYSENDKIIEKKKSDKQLLISLIIVIITGTIATVVSNLFLGIIAAIISFFIFYFVIGINEAIVRGKLEKRAKAGDLSAKKKIEWLDAKEAQENYDKGLQEMEKNGSNHAKKWFTKAAKLGHLEAQEKVREIAAEEARELQKSRAEARERDQREKERLATLPKCPRCGRPIEQKYVSEYWGWRYYHAVYTPDCKWMDENFKNPHKP